LRERGIRTAQGYVFAPPLPGSSFLKLVEAIDPRRDADLATEPGAFRTLKASNFSSVA
jgi:hypothetical protein